MTEKHCVTVYTVKHCQHILETVINILRQTYCTSQTDEETGIYTNLKVFYRLGATHRKNVVLQYKWFKKTQG